MPARPLKTLADARKKAAWQNMPESIYTLGMDRGDTESMLPLLIESERGPAPLPDDEILEMFGLAPSTMSPDVQRTLLGLEPIERQTPAFGETPATAFLEELGGRTIEQFVPETKGEAIAMGVLAGIPLPQQLKRVGVKKVTQLVKKATELANKGDFPGAKQVITSARGVVTEMSRLGTKGARSAERTLAKGERAVDQAVSRKAAEVAPIKAASQAAENVATARIQAEAPLAVAKTIPGKEALKLAKREGKQAIRAARGGANEAAEGFLRRAEAAAKAGTGEQGKAAVDYVNRLQDKLLGVMEKKAPAVPASAAAAGTITKAGVEAGRRAIGKTVARGFGKAALPIAGWTLAGLAFEAAGPLSRKGMRVFGPSEEDVESAKQRATAIEVKKQRLVQEQEAREYARALSGAAAAEQAYFRIHDPADLQIRVQQMLLQGGMAGSAKDEAYSRIMEKVPMAEPGRIVKSLSSTAPSILSIIEPQTEEFEQDAKLRMKALDDLLSGGG